jgi:hypothetical protein
MPMPPTSREMAPMLVQQDRHGFPGGADGALQIRHVANLVGVFVLLPHTMPLAHQGLGLGLCFREQAGLPHLQFQGVHVVQTEQSAHGGGDGQDDLVVGITEAGAFLGAANPMTSKLTRFMRRMIFPMGFSVPNNSRATVSPSTGHQGPRPHILRGNKPSDGGFHVPHPGVVRRGNPAHWCASWRRHR